MVTATAMDGQQVQDAGIDLDWLTRKIEYHNFQECIHCGLCTASCPTYVETGNENDSPRGRIYLMRAVTDGRLGMGPHVRRHLELCLDCRACESACPSGVQYGTLIGPFKIALQKDAPAGAKASLLQRMILHHLFPYAGRVKTALAPARLFQKLGLLDLAEQSGMTRLLPPTLRRMMAMLPRLSGAAPAARGPAAYRSQAGPRRPLPRLRGRRDVPRDQRRDGQGASAERLRGDGPARSGLLRCHPLSFRSRAVRHSPWRGGT